MTIQPKGFPPLPDGWKSEWETFPSSDQKQNLFGMLYHAEPWQSPKALFVLHGMGEHGGRYLHLPHYLQKVVDAVYALDHRGHGRSEGLRGHTDRFDRLADDAALALQRLDAKLKERFGKSEIHVLGHSLGGHIALRMMFLHPDLPIASATVSAPFLATKEKPPFVKRFAAHALHRIWGSLEVSTALDASTISRDPEVIAAYKSDRLVHDKMTPNFFVEMLKAIADTMKRETGIQPPLQVLVPLADRLVDPERSLEFYRTLEHRDKRLRTYPGTFHEPLNDLEKDQVFADVASWIREHGRSAATSG